MTKFTDNLWSDLVQEHGAALAHADRPEPGRARPRPRVIAGSTLALAGVGTALALALTATRQPAGVRRHEEQRRLGVGDDQPELGACPRRTPSSPRWGSTSRSSIYMATGAAAVSGPVTCTPAPGRTCRGRR